MTIVRGEPQLDMSAIEVLADELEDQARGVIHCGPRACAATDCDALEEAVTALSSRLGWPVIADGASGVRGTLHHADALCRAGVMPPVDFALRIGRAPTNKAVDAWLANAGRSVLVDRDGWMLDPNAVAQTMVIAEPARAIRELELSVGPRSGPSSWQQEWRELDRGAHQAIAAALPDACAAMVAAHAVAEAAARSGSERPAVHVASSMAVRDFDLVARRATATSNRGVNGIDGTIATALGIALATGQPTVALLGDLALAHDLGGLHAATQAGVTLTLVVVNNGGGGIFEMLPVAGEIDRARFERLFATPQSLDIRNAAQALGARYVLAKRGEIAGLLEDAPEGVAVIEIREDREREAERRAQTWQRVTAALRRFSS